MKKCIVFFICSFIFSFVQGQNTFIRQKQFEAHTTNVNRYLGKKNDSTYYFVFDLRLSTQGKFRSYLTEYDLMGNYIGRKIISVPNYENSFVFTIEKYDSLFIVSSLASHFEQFSGFETSGLDLNLNTLWTIPLDSGVSRAIQINDTLFAGVSSYFINYQYTYPKFVLFNGKSGKIYMFKSFGDYNITQINFFEHYTISSGSLCLNSFYFLVNEISTNKKIAVNLTTDGELIRVINIDDEFVGIYDSPHHIIAAKRKVINQLNYNYFEVLDNGFNKLWDFKFEPEGVGVNINNFRYFNDRYYISISFNYPDFSSETYLYILNLDGSVNKILDLQNVVKIRFNVFDVLTDGSLLMAGRIPQNNFDAFIMKTDTCGNVEPGDWGVSFTQEDCGFVGVEDVIKPTESKIALYPNPNNGQFRMENEELGVVEVYNLQGQKVHSQRVNQINELINLNQPQSGVYLLRFIQENGTVKNAKFVVE